ncbi:lysophospholipid acyltransferase family protein [Halpernia sp.]|uniref:lysophospholipid acyltransferase family protein n=1 Tax=Halpernia sp. TaxID=2782209 RepID=UPI003A8D2039
MTIFFNYLWRLWFLILAAIATFFFGFFVFLLTFNPKHYKYCYIFIRLWCFTLFYGMGFRYELIKETQKEIDKNLQYIFISNHTSIMDVMLPCILMPNHPLVFVGKKELVKIPIFGQIYKRICVMVDRSSVKSRSEVYRRCAERMREGQSIVLFPEGGVPDDTSILLGDFKDGAFTLASKHQFPIAVFTFVGLKEMFPFNNKIGHPGKVKVYFNDVLEPNEKVFVLKETAQEEIKKTLEKNFKPNI